MSAINSIKKTISEREAAVELQKQQEGKDSYNITLSTREEKFASKDKEKEQITSEGIRIMR